MTISVTEPLRRAVLIAWRSRRLWLLQFLLTPILAALAVAELLVPEAHIWQLVLTLLLAVAIFLAFLWMQAATMVYFADYHAGEERPADAFRSVWQTLAAFAGWAVVLATCLYLVSVISAHQPQYTSYLRSIMPVGVRKILTESRVDHFFTYITWLKFWVVLPGFFLPMGLQIAKHGVHGLSRDGWNAWSRIVFGFRYWIIFVLFLAVGVCIPQALVYWHPPIARLSGEAISLGLRFFLAWLVSVTAWVVFTSALGWFNAETVPDTTKRA